MRQPSSIKLSAASRRDTIERIELETSETEFPSVNCGRMGNAFFKYFSRAKPDPEPQEDSRRAQNQAAVEVPEQVR